MQRCATLASYGEEPGRLTPFATPSMRGAADTVAGWMCAAGMSVRTPRDRLRNGSAGRAALPASMGVPSPDISPDVLQAQARRACPNGDTD
jgi:hypothetical protein